ncbi:putative ABC sugar transporter, periplasmic sugar binding protein [Magnetofaba australis IT-1]|uniref:Putative ABC sugar transporter, periplasmic sugar binding protein n=1 Tax=Magnetofaba australis IT-1 TaxID=1434232 RepID=A0A1Y2K3K0_9PROT|nr:putative ABC sugar transporter, periplasmic sugar binding protein [Magnetofaba australis IT-1]
MRHLLIIMMLLTWPLPTWAQEADAEHYFFISHAGVTDPFWRVPFKGAADAAAMQGVKLTILAPERVNDHVRQMELFESALGQQPAGVAITVSDRHDFSRLLKQARKQGVPVIAVNTRPADDDRARNPYLAYVGMDDHAAGRAMAKRMLERGKLHGRVVVVTQQAGHAGLESRFAGISEVLGGSGCIVERLNLAMGEQTLDEQFAAYWRMRPDLAAVISLGPEATHPIGRVIKQRGAPLYFASFDLSPFTAALIRDGLLDFTVDQQPYMQGRFAVELLVLAHRYKLSPPDINTGIGIIDNTNLGAVENLSKQHIR